MTRSKVNISIDRDLHQLLRMLAAVRHVNVSTIAESILSEYLHKPEACEEIETAYARVFEERA